MDNDTSNDQSTRNYLENISKQIFSNNTIVNPVTFSPVNFLLDYFGTGTAATVFTSRGTLSLKQDAAIVIQASVLSNGFNVWTGKLNIYETQLMERHPEWFAFKENGYYFFDYGDKAFLFIRGIESNPQVLLNNIVNKQTLNLPFFYYEFNGNK
jgi:hypothetical protein